MDRRSFLRDMIGGVAAAAAVRTFPFRVYSFPTIIKPLNIGTWESMTCEQILAHLNKELQRAMKDIIVSCPNKIPYTEESIFKYFGPMMNKYKLSLRPLTIEDIDRRRIVFTMPSLVDLVDVSIKLPTLKPNRIELA